MDAGRKAAMALDAEQKRAREVGSQMKLTRRGFLYGSFATPAIILTSAGNLFINDDRDAFNRIRIAAPFNGNQIFDDLTCSNTPKAVT